MGLMMLPNDAYFIGWICVLAVELAAAQAMLDEEYSEPPLEPMDTNTYVLGRVGQNNVVIASLPCGSDGLTSAAVVATNLRRSFPEIRFGMLVGIGGAAPDMLGTDPKRDIRLGDVVVSTPDSYYGGIVQYDFGRTVEGEGYVGVKYLNAAPTAIGTAVNVLRARAMLYGYEIAESWNKLEKRHPNSIFVWPGPEVDQLFQSENIHDHDKKDCSDCAANGLVRRKPRAFPEKPVVHYGMIGAANQIMRSASRRDQLQKEHGIICFDTSAGLVQDFPCLVIRGICDYCDSHANDQWRGYAAGVSAAYARELIEVIPLTRTRQISLSNVLTKVGWLPT